jgi:hypothetical protein
MDYPKVIGKIQLPEYQPVKYECACCGNYYTKYNFVGLSWGNNVCIKCEVEKDELMITNQSISLV